MKTHNLVQNTPAWLAHRAPPLRNASDSPNVMGEGYVSRSEFMREWVTGIRAEIDAATQALFDDGHRSERLALPLMEEIVGEALYPVTGTEGKYGASFDGLTIAENIGAEHKKLNNKIRACKTAADLPLKYRIQMEVQCLVSGAEKILFMATNWDGNNQLIEEVHFWYEPDLKFRAEIDAAWNQFEEDAKTFVPPEVIPAAVAAPIIALPTVSIKVEGSVALISNLAVFGRELTAFIAKIPEKPETDQQFADCKAACGALKEAQEALDAAEAHALGQVASFDEMKRTKAVLFNLARDTRLALEKLVVARERKIKEEIVAGGRSAFAAHIEGLNKRLGKNYMPVVPADFAGVIKNKRTITSLKDAVDTELSRAKISANSVADAIQINLATLTELSSDHKELFADTAQIVHKANDDLTVLIKSRIDAHKAAEQKKADELRAQIQREEEAKANAKAQAAIAAAATPAPPVAAAPAPIQQPAVQPAAIQPKPKAVATASGPRPSDTDIIKTLAERYRVTDSKALQWVCDMDIPAAIERLADQVAA